MEQNEVMNQIKDSMEKSIKTLQADLQKIRTGRASPNILENIKVESYGSMMPIQSLASVTAPEARLILVNPFDKSTLVALEKAILTSGIGLTPANDGKVIRIQIPVLTEERRKDIAKQVKKCGEEIKIAVRKHRQDGNTKVKSLQKDKIFSEDLAKRVNDDVQKLTDQYIKKVDELCQIKEKEVLSV